jgi:hypothetical protein
MTINEIANQITSFINTINNKVTKVTQMPAILLISGAKTRQGLSPLRSLNNICVSLESLGVPTKSNPDGSPNLIVSVLYETLKEIYRAQTEDAVIQGGIDASTLTIQSNGANAAGPVASVGTNILPTNIWGVIQ